MYVGQDGADFRERVPVFPRALKGKAAALTLGWRCLPRGTRESTTLSQISPASTGQGDFCGPRRPSDQHLAGALAQAVAELACSWVRERP